MDLSQFMEMSNAHRVQLMLLETMEGGMATSMGQSLCFLKVPIHEQTLHTRQFSSYVPTLGFTKFKVLNHVQTLRTRQFSSYVSTLGFTKVKFLNHVQILRTLQFSSCVSTLGFSKIKLPNHVQI